MSIYLYKDNATELYVFKYKGFVFNPKPGSMMLIERESDGFVNLQAVYDNKAFRQNTNGHILNDFVDPQLVLDGAGVPYGPAASDILAALSDFFVDAPALSGATDLLGGIAHNAAAPTPGVSGKYYFTSAGVVSWITGTPTVAIGDEVIVVYDDPDYTYTHLPVGTQLDLKFDKENLESARSQSTTKAPTSKLLDDELSKIANTTSIYNVTYIHPLEQGLYYSLSTAIFNVPSSVRKSGIIITYEISAGVWEIKRFVGNVLTEWGFTESKWLDLNTNKKSVNYIVAAFDATDEEKLCADFIALNENNGITQIGNAITALGASGGTVILTTGTYSASGDIGVYVSKANVTIEGQGYGTLIKRGGGGSGSAIVTQAGGNNLIVRNLSVNTNVNVSGGGATGGFIENVKENTTVVIRRPEFPTPYILAKQADGITGINAAIALLPSSGGLIQLERGIYSGSVGVNLNKDNIILQGQGRSTEIKRDGTGVNDVFNNSSKRNCILRDLSLTQISRPSFPSEFDTLLVNVWVNGVWKNENSTSVVNVLTVGKNQQYAKLSDAYNSIDSSKPLPSATNKFEIHVYGYILETAQLNLHKRFVDIIGHNATIELYNTNAVYGAAITDNQETAPAQSANYGAFNDSTYKDLHFIRTGEVDGYNFPCVSVSSSHINLINCKFENQTTSTHEYDPLTPSGTDDIHGARRHGLVLAMEKYGVDCKTRLVNCIGIGSPFGFQNTRGIYIIGGSPKLYNCIGIAGGLGERSHGIICHRYSNAVMYNCIGYGSIYSDSQSNGIQCQSMANPVMYNCIGYAGRPNNSAGICCWNRSQPTMHNCTGFAGIGENSVGLEVSNSAKPRINGGYFGVEDKSYQILFTKDSGQLYQSFRPVDDCPYTILNVVLWLITPSLLPTGTTFSLETDEAIPQVIVDKVLCDNTLSAMLYPAMVKTSVASNVKLKVIWRNSGGTIISVSNEVIRTQVSYNYNKSGGHGCLLTQSQEAEIINAKIESNEASNGLETKGASLLYIVDKCTIKARGAGYSINCESALEYIPVYNSRLKGNTNNVTSFANITSVLSSSNYNL